MEVGTALLCDFAIVREGLLHVISGGVTRVWRQSFPAEFGCALALVFELHPMETERPHELEVRIIGEDGAEVARLEGGFQAQPGPGMKTGEMMLVPVAIDLRNVQIPGPGGYSIVVRVDTNVQRTLAFWVERTGPVSPGEAEHG